MRCPDCHSKHTHVDDSRIEKGGTRLRRRVCRKCGKKFITRENVTFRECQLLPVVNEKP